MFLFLIYQKNKYHRLTSLSIVPLENKLDIPHWSNTWENNQLRVHALQEFGDVKPQWRIAAVSILDHLRSSNVLQTPNVFQQCKGCWSNPNIEKSSMLARLGHFFGRKFFFGKPRTNTKKDDSLIPTKTG